MFDRLTPTEVKAAINNFLWSYLPPSTTIAQADEIACRWFDDLEAAHQRAQPQPEAKSASGSGRFA
jgi:hypothetical protein